MVVRMSNTKTIVIAGYGPGISNAVAEKFGAEGFSVALVARNADRLASGVKSLESKGIKAAAFPSDLSDLAATRALIGKVRSALGPITVLHWNAYPPANLGGDFLTAKETELQSAMNVALTSLIVALQESIGDMRQNKNDAAVLITNGGLGYFDPKTDEIAVQWGAMSLGVVNSAKHKAAGMLSVRLKEDGIYVGEVMVLSVVKGTAFDRGVGAPLEASTVGDKFWEIYKARKDVYSQVA